jgi:hypothetical protein
MAVATAMAMLLVPVAAAPALALSCAPDPDALSYTEMIDGETTGKERYPIMFLGIVASVEDVAGGRGGRTIARIAVAEHPVGYTPLVSDVRFWRDPPGVSSSAFDFRRDGRYVVIARRLADGSFAYDGDCGQTRRLNRERFRELVRYARNH